MNDRPSPGGGHAEPPAAPDDPRVEAGEIPWGQRFFDRPFLLLILGLLIMLISYTGWGLWEVMSLTPAPLP